VHAKFSYQIGGAFKPKRGVKVVDRDRHDPPAADRYGICYLNGYQAQPDELHWWRTHHPKLLLRHNGDPVVDSDWGEQLLDTSTKSKREALAEVIGKWIRGCARHGYRAVEPDNLDSWHRSKGELTRSDNLGLARLLIAVAHGRGLAIAQKNTVEIGERGRRAGFDFAIAEECQAYSECRDYRQVYGKHLIEVEYPDNGGRANFDKACRLRGDDVSIVYRDRDVTPAGEPGFKERWC